MFFLIVVILIIFVIVFVQLDLVVLKAYIESHILDREPPVVSRVSVKTLESMRVTDFEIKVNKLIDELSSSDLTIRELIPSAQIVHLKYKYVKNEITVELGETIYLKDILYHK